jgi:cation transport ATPase
VDFRKRFWISLVLTLPILGLSPLLQKLVGLREAIHFPGDIYVLFGFASAVSWYGGWPCLKGLFKELESRQPGMMTLVAVAITTAYVYSSAVVGLAGALGGGVEDIAKGSSLVAAGQLGRAAEKILPTALAPFWKLASRAGCRH